MAPSSLHRSHVNGLDEWQEGGLDQLFEIASDVLGLVARLPPVMEFCLDIMDLPGPMISLSTQIEKGCCPADDCISATSAD